MGIHKILPILALAGFALVGLECPPPGGSGDDSATGDTGTFSGGDDTGAGTTGFDGTITGTIKVQLFDIDTDGEYVYKDWSVWDGNFPFGAVWVYAFSSDEMTGQETFYANQSILTPSIEGDTYSLTFAAAESSVRVGSQLDFYNDGIMGTSDPVGIYADEVSVTDGSTAAGVDITLLSYWNNAGGGGGSGTGSSGSGTNCDGGGSGGGNGDGSTTISGDIIITEAYAAGDAVAMLMTTDQDGPVAWDWTTPEPSGGGAEGAYAMAACGSGGTDYILQGCWDSNFNSLVESDDKCGPYIYEPDQDGNPITVADENLEEYDIQIPLGEYNLNLVPFVNLSGTITHLDGAFSGNIVRVGALKYKPAGDFAIDDLEDAAYDYQEFDTSEGDAALYYSLDVPSNTIVYLLAWENEDGDALINESEEALGSGSSSENGRLPTGESAQIIDIQLSPYTE